MAFPRCASALLIALALLTASPGVTSEGPASASAVRAFPGGDLEGAGVFEAALAARAPAGELIVMCVGDTQDPRRVVKDPALKTLSVDFAVNLVRNLAGVGVEHYFMLTSSEALCRRLQTDYGVEGCVWSSLWADHPGQVEWAVKADEMFLMWAKQWHYVARALRTGLNVMRLDGDVFFGENPYPLLKGPYLGRFNIISQNDIFQAFTRPTCVRHEQAAPIQAGFAENHHDREFVEAPAGADLPPCLLAKLRPELNIGMLYVQNASPDGAAVEIIETVVSRIVELLGKPALRDKPGKILKEQLLDQPLFRHEASTRVREGVWFTSKGDLVPFYTDGDCPHREDRCNEISRMRAIGAEFEKRFGDKFQYDVEADVAENLALLERVRPLLTDTVALVNARHASGDRILVEGANATMLDLDFGTYPYVTSSNPSMGGICAGLGLAPNKLGACVGVAKAYTTRVGSGPYPTEVHGPVGDALREAGAEFGTTTGRPRRCGWLDIPALRFAHLINGFTGLNLTKLDVLGDLDEILIGVAYRGPGGELLESMPADLEVLEAVEVEYETLPGWKSDISGAREWGDLPAASRAYVERVEELMGVPVNYIGVGPGRDALVFK